MLKRFRNYLTPMVATLFIFVLAAGALAVAGEVTGKDKVKEPKVEAAEAIEVEAEEAEVEVESEEASDGVNHGHCVSYWAHQAKEQGLEGKAKGEFVSSIAQNEEAVSAKVADGGTPDATCDFQAQLDEAKAEQSAEAESEASESGANGKSKGKGKGRSGDGS